MFLLGMFLWVVVFYGFVVWLSRRFKSHPWHKAWKWAILVVGFLAPWADQLVIRFVMVEHYCKVNQDWLGQHTYQSTAVKANQVTWLTDEVLRERRKTGQVKPTLPLRQKITDNDYVARELGSLYCSQGKQRGRCEVKDYRLIQKFRFVTTAKWTLAEEIRSQIVHGNDVVAENAGFVWNGSWFFRFFPGITAPIFSEKLFCGLEREKLLADYTLPVIVVEDENHGR